ncbi:RNA ligase (ATP) [Cytophagaceae bacterium DM2B3-1]|uniref:RNA ligase (ATP) n=1 Tax=Xanthocytophaga flava TaxID=3048013 RepID=A0ABT7CM97_9BACT|nr:RNA ligase (ATP) [Xanthocytophaga flavus]MDJ1494676.1 RNA ligase (ATP) [Xanthocytophaga flavus]
MRKLASIQRIKNLEPIPEADAIEKATVLGWQLVVKKGEFAVGDLCVYCEIDSMLPEKPEFEFLKARGMRIRTVRLRGQVSQGICFPLGILPQDTPITEDLDVTDLLDIIKYEPPVPAQLAGIAKGLFPSFIPKTDETRVQVLQELLDACQGDTCYVTEKLDGSSVTYYLRNGEFGVCSRNLELFETPDNSLWKVARTLKIEEKLRSLNGNFALQGEIIGEGIQGNLYKLKGQTVQFFNVFDIDQYKYLDFEGFQKTITQLDLTPVPILETDFALSNDIQALVEKSKAKSVLNPAVWREGIVIRPLTEKVGTLGRVSFKAINPEFLLKYE